MPTHPARPWNLLPILAGLAALAGTGPAHGQQLAWSFETDGAIYGSPVVSGTDLLVGSSGGLVYALDRATGRERWQFRTGGAVDAAPAAALGRVYFPSRDGNFYAVDARTGTLDWVFRTEGGETRHDFWDFYLSDPLVLGSAVVFGSGDGSVYALEADTGELLWRFESGGAVHAAPVTDGTRLYVGGFDGGLHALNPTTGVPHWSIRADGNEHFPEGAFQRAPVLHEGVLYVGSRDYQLYAVEAATGRVLWKMEESRGWIVATPLVVNGSLYFGASDGQQFYAVDRISGQARWSVPVQTRVFGSAVLVGESVVFGGFSGILFALDPESGETLWRFQTPASRAGFLRVHDERGELNDEMRTLYRTGRGMEAESRILELGSIPGTPAFDGDRLYFGTTEGVVYALEPG
jgi:eukaryotic-like serine/threonine-protein kinase